MDEKKNQVVDETRVATEVDHQQVKPIGDVVRVSGDGVNKKNHFTSFEYEGVHYDIEDFAMFCADGENKKPYVGIIRDVIQTSDGKVRVCVQWFYRPEDTEKRGGGTWASNETRELYYSFHRDEIPVESVIHKCLVYFIPMDKQIPYRKQHPGFIVQKVYDTERKKLFKFTDKVYPKDNKEEIDILIQKTMSWMGELPAVNKKAQSKKKRLLSKK